MTRRFGLGAMVLALQLLACEGGRHDRTLLGPEMAVAGASGCYTVKVTHTLTSTGVPRQFAGDITGDLQGVAQIGFTEINAFTGVTNTSSGNATWVITGGIIPELIGSVFVTRFDNRN